MAPPLFFVGLGFELRFHTYKAGILLLELYLGSLLLIYLEMGGGLTNYLPGLVLNVILLISGSQIARITRLSHWNPTPISF
jgi:hypothetical protein